MKLSEIYNNNEKPIFSFEVFPPKGENQEEINTKIENLLNELKELQFASPKLISITYGAGGSNRDNSFEIVKKIKNELNITPLPHFTCICSNKEYIKNYIETLENTGIQNVLTLRGDEPKDIDVCYRDFRFATDLIEYIKTCSNLEFAVASYPQKHPESENLEKDIEILAKKQELGARVAYTQLFFDNEYYFKYIEKCQNKNIKMPIIPGILPVISFSQFERMANLGGVIIEKKTYEYFEKFKNSKEDTIKAGIDFATKQIEELLIFGAKGIHFYTLNKSASTKEILKNIIS